MNGWNIDDGHLDLIFNINAVVIHPEERLLHLILVAPQLCSRHNLRRPPLHLEVSFLKSQMR